MHRKCDRLGTRDYFLWCITALNHHHAYTDCIMQISSCRLVSFMRFNYDTIGVACYKTHVQKRHTVYPSILRSAGNQSQLSWCWLPKSNSDVVLPCTADVGFHLSSGFPGIRFEHYPSYGDDFRLKTMNFASLLYTAVWVRMLCLVMQEGDLNILWLLQGQINVKIIRPLSSVSSILVPYPVMVGGLDIAFVGYEE